jgi:NADPH2:quinone reductase
MRKSGSLTGVFFAGEMARQRGRLHPVVDELLQAVADGTLKTTIDRSFPLSDAAAAHEYMESQQGFGRVILVP